MLIKPDKKYITSLVSLWHKVFGDEEEYINLFFKKAYFNSETFAEIIDGEVVSALYLLNAEIHSEAKTYKGRYLYAAATLPEYRGKGYMGKLIEEALEFASREDLDFIALVPANDGLYGYYEKFGFTQGMYKYRYPVNNEASTMRAYREITDYKEFCKIRSSSSCNMLIYDDVCNEYAFECLRYAGTRIFYLRDNAYYAEGEELFCDDKEVSMNLINNLCGESVVYTNCPLDNSQKVRNGMLYCFSDNLKDKEFYMNIALD